jgi:hypothetical protein
MDCSQPIKLFKSQTIITAKTYIAASSLQGIFSYVRDVCKDISNSAPEWQQNREVKKLKSYNTNGTTEAWMCR